MAERVLTTAPPLGRDALTGNLRAALQQLEGEDGASAAWQRSWLLTAIGRYGEALAACEEALEGPPILQACSRMTEAMLYRQIALHERAEVADIEALAFSREVGSSNATVRAAIRVGQVADAVGLGLDPPTLLRRLKVAAAAVTTAGSWRQRVRLTWVRGEVEMVRGRYTHAAKSFGTGARISGDQGARRHEAKSLIFLAAACAARGDVDEAVVMANRGLELAALCEAAPLIWPAELVLAEVDPGDAPAHLDRARVVARNLLHSLPEALRPAARRRPPMSWLLPPEGTAAPPEPHTSLGLATDA